MGRLGIGLAIALVSIGTLLGDYATGPIVQFPVLFVLPVGLAAWFLGAPVAAGLSVLLVLCRAGFPALWDVPWSTGEVAVNASIRVSVLVLLAVLVGRASTRSRAMAERIDRLEGFLQICSACKRIHHADDTWTSIEEYVSQRSRASFTHGLCPPCAERLYGDLLRDTDRDAASAGRTMARPSDDRRGSGP